jgi:serine/threonine-protein kinase
MLEVGSVLDGKYKVLSKIGQGGMSVVYLAMNERANKPWAIKEIRKDSADGYEVVGQGLIAETEMLKRLQHTNLPSIIDVIEGPDSLLVVMDYIEGNPLSLALKEYGAQSQDDVVKWARQLCGVFGYLHSRTPPIIYRDMKPSNVMLKPDGDVVLIDFGTAREFKAGRVDDTIALGTQGYAAPEQYGQHQTDARTDIYNLGATMYHLVTGHNPSEPPYVMYPIRLWSPALSSGLEAIITKCTQRDPNHRYQSAAELLYDLEHYHDLDIERRRSQRIKMRLFVLMVGLMLLSAAGMVGFALAENAQRDNSYNALLLRAQSAYGMGIAEAADYYNSAARLDPTRPEAYEGLLSFIKQDQEVDETEDELMRHLATESNGAAETNIERFKQTNPTAYASFAYDMGVAYFFTYRGGAEAGQMKAQSWLADAAQSDTLDSQRKAVAEKLSFIAAHYDSVFKNNDGLGSLLSSESYGPQQFWADLVNLSSEDSVISSGSTYVGISVYSYVITVVHSHYADFINAGVSVDSLTSQLTFVEQALGAISTSNPTEQERIEATLAAIEQARLNVLSASTHQTADTETRR